MTPPWKMDLSLTHAQWKVAMEAMSQFVENVECSDEHADSESESESESLKAAREVLGFLQAPLIALD